VCLGDTRLKVQVGWFRLARYAGEAPQLNRNSRRAGETSNLVDAFDSEDSGNFSNIGEDGFELAAVDNF
jgi:hypothetical protein